VVNQDLTGLANKNVVKVEINPARHRQGPVDCHHISLGAAQAATQGALGASSTGSVTVSASVPSRARISGLTDVSFINQNPTVAALGARNVCVWSNTATKRYRVTATGSGAASAFTLANGALRVAYTVRWNALSGRTTGTALTRGTASAAFASTATHQTCASGPTTTSSLIIGITAANLGTMRAATNYTGTLTLVITPV
jgi:hypothetical protein